MLDTAIVGGRVVTEERVFEADVGIEGGRIASVAPPGGLPPSRREIDASGLLVLPGAIDIHFHVRAPANPERGTFESETKAAAAGGVTTVLEMPISRPCCATRAILERRRALGEGAAYVNFGLYGAPGLLDRGEVLAMAEAGACGFKIFTHAAPPDRADEFAGLCLPDEEDIYRALELTRETGLLTSVHAEHEGLLGLFEQRARAGGGVDARSYAASRPAVVESLAVAGLAAMCEDLGARVHIAHVSSRRALAVIERAQAAGLPMTGETCPHYLLFTEEDFVRHGPFAMIKPPLREQADCDALWGGLISGALSAVTTDHSPFTLAEKERGLENIWRSAIGLPGVEALVPLVMTEALGGRIGLTDAARLLSAGPARLFGMAGERGGVAPGLAADLLLYDPRPNSAIETGRWLTKASAIGRLYDGRPCRGAVHTTIVGGAVVYAGGQIQGGAPAGRFVRPAPRH